MSRKAIALSFFLLASNPPVCADSNHAETQIVLDISPLIQKASGILRDPEVAQAAVQLYSAYLNLIETVLRKVAQQCGPQERVFAQLALDHLLDIVQDPKIQTALKKFDEATEEEKEYFDKRVEVLSALAPHALALREYFIDHYTVTKSEMIVEGDNTTTITSTDLDPKVQAQLIEYSLKSVIDILQAAKRSLN